MPSVKNNYPQGLCPDCGEDIPPETESGEECKNCGHVYWSEEEAIAEEERDRRAGLYGPEYPGEIF